MTAKDGKVRELIAEEAADWFVANREGLAQKERHAFVAWLQTSPVHVEEYLAHASVARDLREVCEYSDDALEELLARARTQPDPIDPSWSRLTSGSMRIRAPRWQTAAVMAALCAAVGIGWVVWGYRSPIKAAAPPEAIVEIHLSTRHGEQQSHRLADNSVVHLNTDSAVTVRYSNQERVVMLNAGEAEFEVAHEAARPFRVVAGGTQVIDRGTQFDVLVERDATVVTVVEGSVSISPATSTGREGVAVGHNQQLTVVDGTWPPAQPILVDAQHATAWLHRQIVFDHAPLDKVVAEFNRYSLKPIEIVTPGLQKLEISGVFTTDDPAAFIAFLRSLDNVRVDETPTQIRVSAVAK